MNRKNILIILCLFAFCLSVSAAPTVVLSDNFNDGSIVDWDQNTGTWSAANFDLNGGNLAGAIITHGVTMPTGNDFNISFRGRTDTAGTNLEVTWFTDQNGTADMNGYQVVIQSGISVFRKKVNGVNTNIAVGTGVTIGVVHDVNIVVRGTRTTLTVDGVQLLSGIDTTYTDGTKFGFVTDATAANWAIDNLNVTRDSSIAVTITVLRPLDEKTLIPIDGNWSVDFTDGNYSEYQDANNSSKTFVGSKGLDRLNRFVVDDSNNIIDVYFPSSYQLVFNSSDANTYTLQPYLVSRNDGTEVSFIVYDKFNNTTISNLLVNAKRNISGSLKTVRSDITNGTGLVTFAFLNSISYQISVSDINGLVTHFPGSGDNGSFNNTFSSYNIFIVISGIDVNTFVPNWSIQSSPNADLLVSNDAQYFDVNVSTNYSDNILAEYFDGNNLVASSFTTNRDLNFSTIMDTNNGDFITLRVTISTIYRQDVYIQTYKIVDEPSQLGNGFIAFNNNTGVFGGLIILLCIIFLSVQQFGANLFGNNESQMFLVGLIMIGGGIVFFPGTNFIYVLIALVFGIVVYLQVRT